MKVQTRAIHFSADQKLIFFIENKLQRLEHFFNQILEASVIMKLENTGKIKDKIVEIHLKVPGNILVIKETHKTFEGAFEKSMGVLKRSLVKYKERLNQH